jgi:hypothetical protein
MDPAATRFLQDGINSILHLTTKALFIRLIIRLFQLVFSAGTIFFSHNKSANSVFQPAYQHSQTEPKSSRREKHQGKKPAKNSHTMGKRSISDR